MFHWAERCPLTLQPMLMMSLVVCVPLVMLQSSQASSHADLGEPDCSATSAGFLKAMFWDSPVSFVNLLKYIGLLQAQQ